MRTTVVNTGTELLLGDVVNTHLRFIARELFGCGLRVTEQRTVPDGKAIRETLEEVFPRADVVFVTGGLGPTSDDVTREATAELLELDLQENREVRDAIFQRLEVRGIPMPQRIWRQAQVPYGGEVLPNENGTAPGIYLRANIHPEHPSPHLFLLPGPPRELEPMFREFVLPILRRLTEQNQPFAPVLRKFRVANVGESVVEEKVGEELLAIPGLEVGYCARPGEVDVRVIGPAAAVARAEQLIETRLGGAIFASGEQTLAETIVMQLTKTRASLALAESCTGGFLANQITNVPGASRVLLSACVTYSNAEKIRLLGVTPQSLAEAGAVSEVVAREMAEGMRSRSLAGYAIATTGIAGPGGETAGKPVGTVWIAIASAFETTEAKRFRFLTDRPTFKHLVAQNAFDLLRKRLPK